jgi:putative endonuclease
MTRSHPGTSAPTHRTAPATRNGALGAYGESVAARHLVAGGMVLLDRNWRTRDGEVDLLLRDGDVLVACEVKTRSSLACGTPHEAVDATKVARLRQVAEQWVAAQGASPRDIRVDLVAVLRPSRGASVVDHVVGVG